MLFLFLQQPSRKRERHRRGQSIICGVTCVTCSCLPPNLLSMGIHQGGCLPCSAAGELQPFFALSLGPQQIHCRCHHNHFLSSLVSPFLPQALLLLVYPPNPNKGDLVKVEVRAWPCSATSLPPSYFAQNKS